MTKLLELDASAENVDTDPLEVTRPMTAFLDAWGTWDGATVALERSTDGGDTWHGIGVEVTDNGQAVEIYLPQGHYRLSQTGSGEDSSVSCRFEVPELPPA